jgi:hypothetical protein
MLSSSLIHATEQEIKTKPNVESFPMTFTQMAKIVGPKDSVEIFIPKDSYLMDTLFVDKDSKQDRVYGIDFGKLRRGVASYAEPDLSQRIINTVTKDNGTLITLNLKALKPQTLRVIDDKADNMFFNEYLLGDSIVLKANLVFSQGALGTDYDTLNRQYKYLAERYKMFFNDKHYFGFLFADGRADYPAKIYTNTTIDNERNAPVSRITLTIMNMNTYENYDKIMDKMTDKAFDENYKQLNDILK